MTAAFYDDPNFLYGNSSRKYDEVPSTYDGNRLHWRFEVAWNSKYVYYSDALGQTEATRALECSWNRGRQTFVNYDGAGLTRIPPGRMVITLSNHDGRYDFENSSSPLYPNVSPGKLCRLGVRLASQSSYTWRFAGFVENIRPFGNEEGEKFVEITCVDGWALLQNSEVFLEAVVDTNASVNIASVLARVDWPHLWGSDVTANAITMPLFWADGRDARTILFDIADTFGARLWIGGDGKLKYRPRSTSDSLAASITQSDILKDVPVEQPWKNVWNVFLAKALYSNLAFYNGGSIWGDEQLNSRTWGDANNLPEYSIAAGGTLELEGEYSLVPDAEDNTFVENHEFLSSRLILVSGSVPAGKPRYEFGTATGGGGSDLSGRIAIDEFLDGGSRFRLRLKNNHSATLYSRHITIYSQYNYSKIKGTTTFIDDRSTVGVDKKRVEVATPYLILYSAFTAAIIQDLVHDLADHILTTNKLPRISFESKPSLQFLDVFDRINLSVTKLSISSDYRTGYIEERWLTPNAQSVLTVVQTEPYYVA